MSPKKTSTTDQKIDQILEIVSDLSLKHDRLEAKHDRLEAKHDSLTKTVNRIDTNVKEIIITLAEIALLAGETADRVTKLESKKSFTPFTSGAFVA